MIDLPPVFDLAGILYPILNFDGVCEVVNQISSLLVGLEGEPGLEITNFELENTLETLYQIYYENYANKDSTTSYSTANAEFSSGASSALYTA